MTVSGEHGPDNGMRDPEEIAMFYELCSDRMRELLDDLTRGPGIPRPFGEIEDRLTWPRRRIASMLGGVARLRRGAFEGRRPYRLADEARSVSGRWEIWVDRVQADAIRAARADREAALSPDMRNHRSGRDREPAPTTSWSRA